MPTERYGRAKELIDVSKAWFADRGFEILSPLGFLAEVPPRSEQIYPNTTRQTQSDFRVQKGDMLTPKHVIALTGSAQGTKTKLETWLKLQGEFGFFVIDDCGAILYVEGCDRCTGASDIKLQGFIAPKICGHYGGLLTPLLPKADFLGGTTVLEQLYYVLETGALAESSFDLTRGRHLTYWDEEKEINYYLFSPKHLARYLSLSSGQVRDTLKLANSQPQNLRRFGKIVRVWNLPERPPSQRTEWNKAAEGKEYPIDLGEDDDEFWNTQSEE